MTRCLSAQGRQQRCPQLGLQGRQITELEAASPSCWTAVVLRAGAAGRGWDFEMWCRNILDDCAVSCVVTHFATVSVAPAAGACRHVCGPTGSSLRKPCESSHITHS